MNTFKFEISGTITTSFDQHELSSTIAQCLNAIANSDFANLPDDDIKHDPGSALNATPIVILLKSIDNADDDDLARMADPKCPHCYGRGITAGDWVPYGSTSAQLPDMVCDWCIEEDMANEFGFTWN